MKTTVEISDALLSQAKKAASERGWTLRMVIEDSLSTYLEKTSKSVKRFKFQPHVVGGRGLQPGLDWSQLPSMIHEDLDRGL